MTAAPPLLFIRLTSGPAGYYYNLEPAPMEEAREKADKFRDQVRQKQRKAIISAIRQQYLAEPTMNQEQVYPLCSRTLEKFHSLPHSALSRYLPQLSAHLLQYNVYLMEEMEPESQRQQDEQTLLVQDLFYLSIEHPDFEFPRKFRFVHSGDPLVASYIALVSHQVLPEELAYWAGYMSPEDRQLMYANMWAKELGHLCWVSHPSLRDTLLRDFGVLREAAQAVRDIVGWARVHPDRLKDSKGRNVGQLLVDILTDELEIVMKEVPAQNTQHVLQPKLMTEHIELCVKLQADTPIQSQTLQELLDRLLHRRLDGETELISPLFCIWVLQAWNSHGLRVLTERGAAIMLGVVRYDQSRFSAAGLDMEKLSGFEQESGVNRLPLQILSDGSRSNSDEQQNF